ncbi:MAG TPA: NADH-quinone oxidoreductase subunit J [Candidatus Binataceae bacterium]|jgi:NADH-quinone oxidoreductase subunit J|nr:NADH-quinone oxidoreductase subunit J [Candidatus Binataceae bacterium]
MPLGLFIFLAALAVISALGTIAQRNPVHCLLALVVTLLVIAIMFIGLHAPTVGFLQIIVYAGAIMVLFLFVIWLLNLQAEVRTAPGHLLLKALAALLCAALAAEAFIVLWHAPSAAGAQATVPEGYGSIDKLATTLFSEYLVSFEVTSVLLLAAIVGAVALARRLPASRTITDTAQANAAPAPADGAPRSVPIAQPGARIAARGESTRPEGV